MSRYLYQHRLDNADDGLIRYARRDRGVLRRPYVLPNGCVRAEGIGAVAGVHEYLVQDAGGKPRIIRELLEDEVLLRDAEQIGGLPLLLLHRRDGKNSTPDNLRKRRADEKPEPGDFAGVVGDDIEFVTDKQGGYVKLRILTQTSDAATALRSGKASELSFGYDVTIDPTPGVHPVYGRYDQRQVSRRYDHLALVPEARHGADARVRTDGEDLAELLGIQLPPQRLDELLDTSPPRSGPGDNPMTFLQRLALKMGLKLDGLTDEGLQSAVMTRADALIQLDAAASTLPRPEGRADMAASELVRDMCAMHAREKSDMEKRLTDMEAAMKTAEGERDGYKASLDEYAKKEAEAAEVEKMDAMIAIAERLKVERKDGEADKDFATLRADCARTILGGDVPEHYTDAHYDGLFAALPDKDKKRTDTRDTRYDFGRKGGEKRADTNDTPPPARSTRSHYRKRRADSQSNRS